MGPEQGQYGYTPQGTPIGTVIFTDFYFPTSWDGVGFWTLNPLHLPLGSGRVGGAHYIFMPAGGLVSDHNTNHDFENSSPGDDDWFWYGFHHQVTRVVNSGDNDDVFCMHFQDDIVTPNTTWLALTLKIDGTGTFNSFEYEVHKVTSDGGSNLTLSTPSGGTLITSNSYGLDTWQWVVMGIQRSLGRIQLWIDDVSMGTTTDGSAWWHERGGYLSPDTRTAAGKGTTTVDSSFSDLVSNDDQGGGLITRPGAGMSAPFYRAPAPRVV